MLVSNCVYVLTITTSGAKPDSSNVYIDTMSPIITISPEYDIERGTAYVDMG